MSQGRENDLEESSELTDAEERELANSVEAQQLFAEGLRRREELEADQAGAEVIDFQISLNRIKSDR